MRRARRRYRLSFDEIQTAELIENVHVKVGVSAGDGNAVIIYKWILWDAA